MPIIEGWGTGPWGPMPWGGTVLPDDTTNLGGKGFFERVRREQRVHREQPEILNVLFAVSGLRSKGRLGETEIIAGAGRAVQLRRFRHGRGALGLVTINAEAGPRIMAQPGRAGMGEIEMLLEISAPAEALRMRSRLAKPRITAQRNLSDEELIHMIAEML
jgi:hypothetical protein